MNRSRRPELAEVVRFETTAIDDFETSARVYFCRQSYKVLHVLK